MSAPTLWEEGRLAGTRVVRLAVVACLLLMAVDLLLFDRLSPVFDVGFAVVCIAGALAVKPGDFFPVAVMPPFLMLGFLTVLAVAHPAAIAGAADGFGQALVSGLAHHSGALFAADVNALLVLAIRHRIMSL
ncbi:MAG: hypothetical protein JWO46_3399, partial [Nocardioidaceae bacterium]|nr:hypothetical protein [Nocardioidaceae bacterium]